MGARAVLNLNEQIQVYEICKSFHSIFIYIILHNIQQKTEYMKQLVRAVKVLVYEAAKRNCELVMQWDVPMEMSIVKAY